MVVREWPSGLTRRYWQDELAQLACAPFSTDGDALCVAYFASAEMDCFAALGWPVPVNLLDLFVEFRCLTNGMRPAHGNGLLGALRYHGLASIDAEEKDSMRELILTGGPWSESRKRSANPS
jgi:hypothetical protein